MRPTRLRGARTHNLQGIDLDLEPGTLVAIAGVSGAGKSSLAFGTLYAEGQRRYVESFSAYARQFLERLARPPVDELDPVPAGIAVDRQSPVRTSRSTVGTMTELTDYAKLLWARAATALCPGCGREVSREDPAAAAAALLHSDPGARVVVTFPMVARDAEALLAAREQLTARGYRRVWQGGQVADLDQIGPDRAREGFDVVADRTAVRASDRARLIESIEAAMSQGGLADVHVDGGPVRRFSRELACAHCRIHLRPASPGLFSFNNPIGACGRCRGFGRTIGVDFDKVLPDLTLSIADGAIRPWRGKKTAWERTQLLRHCARAGIDVEAPLASLDAAQRAWLIEGEPGAAHDGEERGWKEGWFGLRAWFAWLETRTYKMHVRVLLARYRRYDPCEVCDGARLVAEAGNWRLGGLRITDFYRLPVAQALAFVRGLANGDAATALLLRECDSRLATLVDVGLGYLTLERPSRTLSGGETQRVALTGALGASLSGAMFVLDEPTVGLHPRDVARLVAVVRRLSEDDNLALLVEHDPDMLRAADRIIELGPAAGQHGGRVIFDGTPAALRRADTPTARALAAAPARPRQRRTPERWLRLDGARGNNLQEVDLAVPLGVLTCVTGVSGSGKSTLIRRTLAPAVARVLGAGGDPPLDHDRLEGAGDLAGVVEVDQAPLGRTSRGNAATYLEAWNVVRKRFTAEPLARDRGYKPGFFSFNVPGGRCESCKGEGAETVEMQFLADVILECPECRGRRFAGEILDVRHRGLDIASVLELTASEAIERLAGDRELESRLAPLAAVGLGYLRLGQPLNTLSGGEAQRLKLAAALIDAPRGSLLVLDEPTAGLHADDVTPLLAVLDALADRGDTVVVVEHDMRVAAHADWVIEVGPGPGAEGGRIVCAGTPESVAAAGAASSPFLARALGLERPPAARKSPRKQVRGSDAIVITGAREHNLRDVSLVIPRQQLVVVTGPSGSGKSTLAFDVLYAEGQRRYLETLSPYARQYMPKLPRPAVDRVTGVPPSVSLEQRTTRGGANSTVATVTEVAHYLRLVYARAGLLSCPDCQVPITARPPAVLAADLAARYPKRAELTLLAPVVRGRKGHHRELLETAMQGGFRRARIDGRLRDLEPGMKLDRYREHDVELVVGSARAGAAGLAELVRETLQLGEGVARVLCGDDDRLLSTTRACPACGRGLPELDPRFFSFNTRHGACATCEGRGHLVRTVGRGRRAREERCPCDDCDGTRLAPLARAVTVGDRPITELLRCSVHEARAAIAGLVLGDRDAEVAAVPLAEAQRRLAFLDEVGVGYLELDRSADTLSGGELQRVRLAAQLGSGLTGVLYVLDEPTIGLHPRDTGRMLGALRALVDRGNSVVVVEHDADTIRAADLVIDVGPGGGKNGGHVVAVAPPAALAEAPGSVTGPALSRPAPVPDARRPIDGDTPRLVVSGARQHNLRAIDLEVPLGRLVAVTGVSGSGKSTLVRDVLLPAARSALGLVTEAPGAHDAIRGADALRSAVEIDQSPIGRTPRSVPATYAGIWNVVRALLAGTPEARTRGYGAARFSFNVVAGRCPACEGQGALTIEMSFLPQVLVPCEVCAGARFSPETLDVTWHGLHAGAILDLDVASAAELFSSILKIARPLRLMNDLGLGYLRLGQPSNTLSGGEAQRLKLVAELATSRTGGTLYVMDEPTTGLHRDDVARLIGVLHRLVDRGDTVVVIEHHPDLILAADWVIDLGPEGGAAGGDIVAVGTPEDIARCRASHTGKVLARERRPRR